MPKRFSTESVSTVASAGTSTRNNECCGRKGILRVVREARRSRVKVEDQTEAL
jgi:hypothetical protein